MILILSDPRTDLHLGLVTPLLAERGAEFTILDPAWLPTEMTIEMAYEHDGLARRLIGLPQGAVDLGLVTAVWSRRPGAPDATGVVTERLREFASADASYTLSGLWDTLDCLWLPSRRDASRRGYNKPYQLAVAGRVGFSIPRTLITSDPERFLAFYEECDGRLISKALTLESDLERRGEGIRFFTTIVRRRDAARFRSIRHSPVLFQEYVPKAHELRITVVGGLVFAARVDSQASRMTRHDWRHYDNDRAIWTPHPLPGDVADLCRELVAALELSFGTIDLVVTPEGKYVFLEINPNGQWAWIEQRTGLPIAAAIADLLVSGKPRPDAHNRLPAYRAVALEEKHHAHSV